MHKRALIAAASFAVVSIAGLASLDSARAEAQESPAISVTLPQATAVDLRDQLASAHGPSPLEVLGLKGAADFRPVVPVPMRDGVHLAASLILPRSAAAERVPVILIRTPYAPASELSEPLAPALLSRAVKSGYAVVIVNDRGTQWSGGSYQWLKGANQDGSDILDWITQQPWSNGKVGTFGCSSSGESQPPLATINHPAHRAMVEMAGGTAAGDIPGYHDQGIFYHGGVPDLAWSWWYHRFGLKDHPVMPAGASQEMRARIADSYSPEPWYGSVDFAALASHLPSEDILRSSGVPRTEWDRLIRLTPGSAEWKEYDFVRSGDRTRVPGLHIDSWYDVIEAYPTVKMFQYLSAESPNQHLVMGPTAHCRMGTESEATSVGDRTVGDGRFDYVNMILRWYDRWLKDSPSAELPAVQYYVLNSSQWMSAEAWPPAAGRAVRWYLSSAGHANSASGDGKLREQPSSGEADEFVDDPMNPVPSLGGSCCSEEVARDQSSVEARQDVLVYTSEPLGRAMRVVGDVDVTLSMSSQAPDTDLMVKLIDVDPAGHPYNLGDTALRLRFRNGFGAAPELMRPGTPYSVKITGLVTAADFMPGHRLRIEVAGSNFPNYERNLQTGGRNFDESAPHTARTRILHDARHPSFIEFTTLPR